MLNLRKLSFINWTANHLNIASSPLQIAANPIITTGWRKDFNPEFHKNEEVLHIGVSFFSFLLFGCVSCGCSILSSRGSREEGPTWVPPWVPKKELWGVDLQPTLPLSLLRNITRVTCCPGGTKQASDPAGWMRDTPPTGKLICSFSCSTWLVPFVSGAFHNVSCDRGRHLCDGGRRGLSTGSGQHRGQRHHLLPAQGPDREYGRRLPSRGESMHPRFHRQTETAQ